ncbi:SOS response-associated peptidase [bacterium AH-315-C07]|nr:SOS response-associated peptidase [bacterium AH-315-C07]
MCYDVKTKLESILKRAVHNNDQDLIREIEEKLIPYGKYEFHHVSGFSHPHLLVYTGDDPFLPQPMQWGLIPSWVKDENTRNKLMNNTINARGETIFEKPSFRSAAKHRRCLIYLDGFYEHHHHIGKTYPHFIQNSNPEPLILGGLWEEWVNKATGEILNSFTLVTTKGNELLSKIHNNPKLKEPRMPLIFNENKADEWLAPINSEKDKQNILKLIKPNTTVPLKAHTVQKLRGKDYLGNCPEVAEEFIYEELKQVG